MASSPSCCGSEQPDAVLWQIQAMDCASEENEIRHALRDVVGIAELRFQLASRSLEIRADAKALAEAEAILRRLGYPPTSLTPATPAAPSSGTVPWTGMIAALVLAAAAEAAHLLLPPALAVQGLVLLLSAGAIALVGLPVYVKGLAALRQGRLNINALMTVAVTGAFLIGHWPEAGMVMALYALAEALEARAADRARQAIRGLMQLAPDTPRPARRRASPPPRLISPELPMQTRFISLRTAWQLSLTCCISMRSIPSA
jgi:Cd2+/Zn2+-exporting ATPase